MKIGMRSAVMLALLSGAVLTACSKLNMENYGKIKMGQSFDEVKQLIGDPARCDEAIGMRICVWGDEKHGVSVSFVAGQVILMSAQNLK